MYAVIEVKGTQVLVEKNSVIEINRISQKKAKTLKVDKVLFGKKGNTYLIGEPYIKGAYAECEIIGNKRSKKVIAFKYRDRKSSQSKKGHRQNLTQLRIKDIILGGKETPKETKKTEKKDTVRKTVKKTEKTKTKKT